MQIDELIGSYQKNKKTEIEDLKRRAQVYITKAKEYQLSDSKELAALAPLYLTIAGLLEELSVLIDENKLNRTNIKNIFLRLATAYSNNAIQYHMIFNADPKLKWKSKINYHHLNCLKHGKVARLI
jgi:hypothetical protein